MPWSRSHWIGVFEPRELGNERIEFFDLVMVAVKESQEAGLRFSGAFDTSEPEVLSRPFEISSITKQFL